MCVTENMQRIIRYISEDGSELMLNFVTFDERFIVKAISKKEQKVFNREKLGRYYDRVMDNSFLQHIYGSFKLTIKGQSYRLMVVENNPIGYIIRGSICVSSRSSNSDLVYFIGEENLEEKFFLDLDKRPDFKETLDKDLEYLTRAKIHSCKIFIDVLKQPPPGNRKVYSGQFREERAYLSVRIFDVVFTECNKKAKKLTTSGVEMMVNFGTISRIESMIQTYIN